MDGRVISFIIFCLLQIQRSAGWVPYMEVLPKIPDQKVPDREIPGWEIGVVRRTSAYIDPYRDTTIIGGREICENPETKIVIVVESLPADINDRMAIRESWADLSGAFVKVGFLLGLSKNSTLDLRNESLKFRDIIQDSFVESYENLTLKGISMLKWFNRTCQNAQFLVKADQDTYVDVPRLIQRLAKYRYTSGVLRGYLCSDFDRDDRRWSKYYTPKYMYPGRKYPDFLQGSAYYMTRDVAEKLFKAVITTPIFHLEDVYITGICAKIAGVTPKKDRGVQYLFGISSSYCVSEYTITCNRVPPNDLRWVLDQLKDTQFNNEEETTAFTNYYLYTASGTASEQFIYYTENDTVLNINLKKLAKLPSMDISSSASSNKKPLFVSACVVHVLLKSQVQILLI